MLTSNTRNGAGMGGGFCPAGNGDGDFKYLYVKQGGVRITIPISADIRYEIIILPLNLLT